MAQGRGYPTHHSVKLQVEFFQSGEASQLVGYSTAQVVAKETQPFHGSGPTKYGRGQGPRQLVAVQTQSLQTGQPVQFLRNGTRQTIAEQPHAGCGGFDYYI